MNLHPDPVVAYIRRHGPIPAVSVSSAQARGRARRYPYWGAVRYELRLRKTDDECIVMAQGRASSDRRSRRLAWLDAAHLAETEDRVLLDGRELQVVAMDYILCHPCA
jgi:hypothetical protein